MAPDITIDRLVWDLAQLEIHTARNSLAAALLRAQMLAKRHPYDARRREMVDVLQAVRHQVDDALNKALAEHS